MKRIIQDAEYPKVEKSLKYMEAIGPSLYKGYEIIYARFYPNKSKEELESKFFSLVNAAEAEYYPCKGLLIKGEPFSKESSEFRFGFRIAKTIGQEYNPAIIMESGMLISKCLIDIDIPILAKMFIEQS